MTRPNRKKKKQGGRTYAALFLLVLVLLAVGSYLLLSSYSRKSKTTQVPIPSTQKPSVAVPQRPVVPPPVQIIQKPDQKPSYPVEKPVSETIAPVTVETTKGTGKLAIIIDDMGTSVQEARSLTAIGVPLTFSIIPGLRNYREVASFAETSGIETMIHIPMQSKGWPQRRLEANGLLVSMASADIQEHIAGYYRDIPRAVGANNHMGSEFTEREDKMHDALEVLQDKGLFFIDSVTSPMSVGQKLAKDMGIKTARRDVFLDNEQNSAYILGQLNQAVRKAKKNGTAIAICHPHPMTIKTLSSALPSLQHQGITLVKASQIVR